MAGFIGLLDIGSSSWAIDEAAFTCGANTYAVNRQSQAPPPPRNTSVRSETTSDSAKVLW
jgi:hypothetical protein